MHHLLLIATCAFLIAYLNVLAYALEHEPEDLRISRRPLRWTVIGLISMLCAAIIIYSAIVLL